MEPLLDFNKRIVQRFNQEVITDGNEASFRELMDERFVNYAAPPGADNGPGGMWNTFQHVLRPALTDLQVHI